MYNFVVFYPIFMSLFWIVGTIYYFIFREGKLKLKINDKVEREGITFLIACFNEEKTIEKTIRSVSNLRYKIKEILVINDGSSDNTRQVLEKLSNKYAFTHINLEKNKGKANALNKGLEIAKYEFIMCLDADTTVDQKAPYFMMETMLKNDNIGAVTGNPRIKNKSSILSKLQIIEYASIVGGIKRSQSIVGKINTVSGVFTLFRKRAVQDVNCWDIDMITEDIAISWKLHLKNWDIVYEHRALCWMLVPETLMGLVNQRIRWAQGGQEVIIRNFKTYIKSFDYKMYLLLIEPILSLVWILMIVIYSFKTIISIDLLTYHYFTNRLNVILLSAFVLTFINVIQILISMIIDSRYEKRNISILFYICWYPTFYWGINAVASIIALPKAIKNKRGVYATWNSPDRGRSE